jgi:hypothetical protein
VMVPSERVIEYYETILGTKATGTQGVATVRFTFGDIVVPTDIERATMKSRGVVRYGSTGLMIPVW